MNQTRKQLRSTDQKDLISIFSIHASSINQRSKKKETPFEFALLSGGLNVLAHGCVNPQGPT